MIKSTKKSSKSKVIENMLKELEHIDQQKESNKISQRQHDVNSKKVILKELNKLKCKY